MFTARGLLVVTQQGAHLIGTLRSVATALSRTTSVAPRCSSKTWKH